MDVVAYAANGPEAIAQYRKHRPDVTLMDLQLPGMSGFDAIRAIRQEDVHARVVVLTMYRGEADVARALKAGASAYLLKDAPAADLIEAIRKVNAGENPLADSATSDSESVAISTLTPREEEVVQFLANGLRNKEISVRLGISEDTVQSHVKNIFSKLSVHDRTEALAVAIRRGIVHLE